MCSGGETFCISIYGSLPPREGAENHRRGVVTPAGYLGRQSIGRDVPRRTARPVTRTETTDRGSRTSLTPTRATTSIDESPANRSNTTTPVSPLHRSIPAIAISSRWPPSEITETCSTRNRCDPPSVTTPSGRRSIRRRRRPVRPASPHEIRCTGSTRLSAGQLRDSWRSHEPVEPARTDPIGVTGSAASPALEWYSGWTDIRYRHARAREAVCDPRPPDRERKPIARPGRKASPKPTGTTSLVT